jgi:hypothetical protein
MRKSQDEETPANDSSYRQCRDKELLRLLAQLFILYVTHYHAFSVIESTY